MPLRILPIQGAELQVDKFCWLMPSLLQLVWLECLCGHLPMGLQGWLLTSCPALLLCPLSNLLQSHLESTPATSSFCWQGLQRDGYGQYKHSNRQIAWTDTGGVKWCAIWWTKTLLIMLWIVELLHGSSEGRCCWNYAKPCTPLPCSIMPCWKEQQLSSWLEWALDWVLRNAVHSSTLCFLQHWLPGSSLDPHEAAPGALCISLPSLLSF